MKYIYNFSQYHLIIAEYTFKYRNTLKYVKRSAKRINAGNEDAEKTTESPTQVVRIRDRRHCKHVMDENPPKHRTRERRQCKTGTFSVA